MPSRTPFHGPRGGFLADPDALAPPSLAAAHRREPLREAREETLRPAEAAREARADLDRDPRGGARHPEVRVEGCGAMEGREGDPRMVGEGLEVPAREVPAAALDRVERVEEHE